MEAGNLTGIIPCVILVFRRVAIDAIPFAAVPAEPFRHGLNLNDSWWSGAATQVSFPRIVLVFGWICLSGFMFRDAQFVLFPFALTIAQRISLAGRLLYDRSL